MSIVVSDTSPIRALHHLRLLHILPELFGDVFIPPAVLSELAAVTPFAPALGAADIGQVRVRAPQDVQRLAALRRVLDPGEAEAISLALEVHAESILIDEHAGRAKAQSLGLNVVGVGGVLVRAKSGAFIAGVMPLMERLHAELHFAVSPRVLDAIRKAAGE